MYKLKTAYLYSSKNPKGIEEINVSNLTIRKLLTDYLTGYLVLTNNHLTGNHFFKLEEMKKHHLFVQSRDITIQTWLNAIGDIILPTTNEEPSFKTGGLKYIDGFQGDYVIKSIHPSSTIDNYPESSKKDLMIYKEGLDNQTLSNNALFVINGLLHSHSIYKSGVKISDGADTMKRTKSRQFGVISFSDVGGVQIKHITTDMIIKSPNINLYNELIIDSKEDLKGKSILLSIAGKLVFDNSIVRKIEDGKIHLMLSNMGLSEHLQRVSSNIDLESLTLFEEDDRLKQYDTNLLKQDNVVLELFRLSQTFLIIVDKPFMFVNKSNIYNIGLYGKYKSSSYKSEIAIDDFGYIIHYFYSGTDTNIGIGGMKDVYSFSIPKEQCERTFDFNRRKMLKNRNDFSETIPYHAVASNLKWLDIKFVE